MNLRHPLTLPITLGLAHGVSDGAAGLLLGSLTHTLPLAEVGALVLLYNGLAFGGQPVVGLITDRARRPRAASLIGLLLMCAALLLSRWPWAAVTLAGLGSAAFHVGGGALSLCATRAGATGPGFFAAPGVLGLALGGALAAAGRVVVWPFLLLLVGLGTAVLVQPLPALSYTTQASEPLFENHDLIMIALLTAIALRSAVWSTFQFVLTGNLPALLALAIAAALGKILGGILADRVGWRRWTVGALLVSAPLLAFGSHRFELLLVGVALLQSATPAALAMIAQLLPRQPATASGLAFGLAIALGAAPLLGGLGAALTAPVSLAGLTVLAALAFWFSGRRRRVAPT